MSVSRSSYPIGRTFVVTESGLAAAAHRVGAGNVQKYLDFQRENGAIGDVANAPAELRHNLEAAEKRLVGFEHIPYRKRR